MRRNAPAPRGFIVFACVSAITGIVFGLSLGLSEHTFERHVCTVNQLPAKKHLVGTNKQKIRRLMCEQRMIALSQDDETPKTPETLLATDRHLVCEFIVQSHPWGVIAARVLPQSIDCAPVYYEDVG